jgi:hypothetical protein
MDGVGAGLPDPVEPLVGALEGSDVGDVAECQDRADLAELDVDFGSALSMRANRKPLGPIVVLPSHGSFTT